MKEKYQVLARKYRPQKFSEVIGQESIVTTLKNAIRFNKIAHAYLFSGSRGIGKTTLARLFAKALNCPNRNEAFEPCCQCSSCLEIASSSSLDVIEIDGASNRGIDDMRQINETIGYTTSSSKYKIYIIDEVHMLTKEAFNALLKTLEEPPEMSKFFFATTEPHKVLPTILSRCQRFDLMRIAHTQMIEKLQKILVDLNREAEIEALHVIASFADGSLRDAESILDQLLCFEEGALSVDIVNRTLGFVSKKEFFALDEAIDAQNLSFAFSLVEKLTHAGKDLSYFLDELIEHFRTLLSMRLQLPKEALSSEMQKSYENSCKLYSQEQLLYILDLLFQATSKSLHKRISIEILLLQLIRSKNRVLLSSVVHRLADLEKKLSIPETKAAIENQKTTASSPAMPAPITPATPQSPKVALAKAPLDLPQPIAPKPIAVPVTEPTAPSSSLQMPKTEAPATIEKLAPAISAESKKESSISSSPSLASRQETLLRFAAVELEGTLKKE